MVLVSTKADDAVLDKLDPDRRITGSVNGSRMPLFDSVRVDHGVPLTFLVTADDQFALPYILEVRPQAEFNYEAGKNKLINLKIGSEHGPNVTFTVPGDVNTSGGYGDHEDAGRQEHLLRLSGWVDVESRVTVGCAGAVLAYIQRRRAVAFLPGDQAANAMFCVSIIEMFTMRGIM